MKRSIQLIAYLLLSTIAVSQSKYNAHEAFDPHFYPYPGNEYRSSGGEPGPKYWQNRADYNIVCTLDTNAHRVTGKVDISYTNNSPDNLGFLWLQLDQNIYRKQSRASATTTEAGGRWANEGFTDGYAIRSLKIESGGKSYAPRYLVNDTRMKVWLENKLPTKSKVTLSMEFSFEIPQYGTDRMGRLNTKHGWIYEIAQWFPRMAVYDDLQGWNTLPYLGAGEFYLEYGDITFTIIAPAGMLVVGSGELLNPGECYTPDELKRYEEAKKSNKTVIIRSEKGIPDRKKLGPIKNTTWKFKINNTRDVAWAASTAFLLDAAKINLPGGNSAIAMSAYPIESTKNNKGNDWRRSTEMVKASIEHYSSKWYEYPYSAAVNVAGIVGGMEYPGIVFCSYQAVESGLWGVTDHEFGHTWFPMIVGTNERKYAWMDEGFNSFINSLSTEAFNKGEFHDNNFFTDPSSSFMVKATFGEHMDRLFTLPDVIQQENLGMAAYSKPAQMLRILREQVLGPERFDAAFREYIRRWAFKHPTPWDFFHTMENVSGEDLAWFWRGWVFNNWKIDLRFKEVKYNEDKPENGAAVTIELVEQMPMPVTVLITEANGKSYTLNFPVEVWQRGPQWTFQVPSTSEIKEVKVDPNNKLPDWDRENNSWKKAF
jgi:hypothetical protein